MRDSISTGISNKFISASVNAVVVDDENDGSHLITSQSLALHSTKAKSTVSHHGNCPKLRMSWSSRNDCRKSNAHSSECCSIKLSPWFFMFKDSPSNIHSVGTFSNENGIFRNVFPYDRVGRIISHWHYFLCHQFFIQLLVCWDNFIQFCNPFSTFNLSFDPFVQLCDRKLQLANQSCLSLHIMTHFLCANICLNQLHFFTKTRW